MWGKKLLEYKEKFRKTHPLVEVYVTKTVGGKTVREVMGSYDPSETRPKHLKSATMKTRYTNIHIHKMAYWRTATKFAEWLYKEWWALEEEVQSLSAAA